MLQKSDVSKASELPAKAQDQILVRASVQHPAAAKSHPKQNPPPATESEQYCSGISSVRPIARQTTQLTFACSLQLFCDCNSTFSSHQSVTMLPTRCDSDPATSSWRLCDRLHHFLEAPHRFSPRQPTRPKRKRLTVRHDIQSTEGSPGRQGQHYRLQHARL